MPFRLAAFLVQAVEKQTQLLKPPEVAYKREILRDGRSVRSQAKLYFSSMLYAQRSNNPNHFMNKGQECLISM